MVWIAAISLLVLVLGVLLLGLGNGMRHRRGIGTGKTVSLDRITLTSRRVGLTGRPDHLLKTRGMVIPEEWKSSRTLRPWHRAQLGVYFLLIEEQLRIRPPHGFIVLGDGTTHQIENTDELRSWVLEVAGEIRACREALDRPIPVSPNPGQCRPCGMRGYCDRARD